MTDTKISFNSREEVVFYTAQLITRKLQDPDIGHYDYTTLKQLTIGKSGSWLKLVIEGDVFADEIMNLAQEFGDEKPTIAPYNDNSIIIGILNKTHNEIVLDEPYIHVEFTVEFPDE